LKGNYLFFRHSTHHLFVPKPDDTDRCARNASSIVWLQYSRPFIWIEDGDSTQVSHDTWRRLRLWRRQCCWRVVLIYIDFLNINPSKLDLDTENNTDSVKLWKWPLYLLSPVRISRNDPNTEAMHLEMRECRGINPSDNDINVAGPSRRVLLNNDFFKKRGTCRNYVFPSWPTPFSSLRFITDIRGYWP
jgi:hypothetical protein